MAKQTQTSQTYQFGQGCISCGPPIRSSPGIPYINGGCLGSYDNSPIVDTVTKEQIYDTTFTFVFLNGPVDYYPYTDLDLINEFRAEAAKVSTYGDCLSTSCCDEGQRRGGFDAKCYVNDVFVTNFDFNRRLNSGSDNSMQASRVKIRELPNYEALVDTIIQTGSLPSCSCGGICGRVGGRKFLFEVKITYESLIGGIMIKMGDKTFISCFRNILAQRQRPNQNEIKFNPFSQGYCVCGLGTPIRRGPIADAGIAL